MTLDVPKTSAILAYKMGTIHYKEEVWQKLKTKKKTLAAAAAAVAVFWHVPRAPL